MCYCPFKRCLFLKYSKAHNFGKIFRRDMGLALLLTLIDALQNGLKVEGQISVLFCLPFLDIATAQKLFNIDNPTGGHTVWVTTRLVGTKF